MSKCVIKTFTGREVNPLNLFPEDIVIEDIAHHLACINRFVGALKEPISVAQHSVFVSRLAVERDNPTDLEERKVLALKGLLHDASEAYLGDVTKWLKASDEMAGYRRAEARVEWIIASRFLLPQPVMVPAVEWADRVMVRAEGVIGFGKEFLVTGKANSREAHPNYPPLTAEEIKAVGRFRPWSWRAAEEAFLTRFRCIQNGVL